MNKINNQPIWLIVGVVFIIAFLPLPFFINKLVFSPELFMNEWLKFCLISLAWLIILDEFVKRKRNVDNLNKRDKFIKNLIVEPCKNLVQMIQLKKKDEILSTWSMLIYVFDDEHYFNNFYLIDDIELHLFLNDFRQNIKKNSNSINSIIQSIDLEIEETNPYSSELVNYISNLLNKIAI